MAKSANQKMKILYLMKILLSRTDEEHGLTLSEIIAALEAYGITAERKSLYDDLEALRLFGIDIEKRRERVTRYHVVSREFELPELKLLVDAVQSSKFITHKKSSELIKKIEGFTSVYGAKQLQGQVFVSNRIKTMNESIYYTVDAVHAAMGENQKISFQYFNWNEKKEKALRREGQRYLVSPWAMTWDDENYYLIAYDSESNTIKHYRVDKMLQVRIEDARREGKDAFGDLDMGLYSKKTFGMYRGRDELVTLRCKNYLAGVMIDRFGQDVPMQCVNSEQFEITVKVSISPLFLTWLMNFGRDVKIISPQRVVDEYIQTAINALAEYGE